MTLIGWIQIVLYCAIIVTLVKPLGAYMTRVFSGEWTFLSPILRPVEMVLYRVSGVDPAREQYWLTYVIAMLFFHVGGFAILYALLRLQAVLPFNPAEQSAESGFGDPRFGPSRYSGSRLAADHTCAQRTGTHCRFVEPRR
jgi:potassium-transporting ATPase potassium-binding subunit